MPYPGFHSKREMTEKPAPRAKKEQDTVGKTENFLTRNVRLITFCLCMAIALALIGPWSIPRLVEWVTQQKVDKDEVLLTEQDVERLIARGQALTWSDFSGYTSRVIIEKDMYMCQFDVQGGNYYLWVTSESRGRPIESVLLFDVKNGHEQREVFAAP